MPIITGVNRSTLAVLKHTPMEHHHFHYLSCRWFTKPPVYTASKTHFYRENSLCTPRKSGCPFCALEIIVRTPMPALKVNGQLTERALIIFHAGGSQNRL